MFKNQKARRTCSEGHTLEESWEQCPFCAADKADAPVATEVVGGGGADSSERVQDPGDGAVVVPRKVSPSRCLAGWLVITEGDDTDQDYRLHAGPNVLGKGAECDVVIKDAHVSHRHAVIDCRDGEYVVEDLESKHGTLVNGEPLNGTRPLGDGHCLRLGNTAFRFRSYGS